MALIRDTSFHIESTSRRVDKSTKGIEQYGYNVEKFYNIIIYIIIYIIILINILICLSLYMAFFKNVLSTCRLVDYDIMQDAIQKYKEIVK